MHMFFLIWGTTSFTTKRYSFAELQIADETGLHSIELRQRVAHVFYIPLFPISQTWVLARQGDSNKYLPNPDLESHIEQMGLQKAAPWYCFAGLILIGVGVLFAMFAR